jgi:thiamine-phosphate pyrophosphorylase
MDFCFYLITDRKSTHAGRPLDEVLPRAFEAGVGGLLLREKDMPDRELYALAEKMRELTNRFRVRLLISSRVDVALGVGADGVHLSGTSLPTDVARRLMGEDKYVAVSTHSMEEALLAEAGGADFITFGPVYRTPSKDKYGEPVGLDALREVTERLTIPVFGLGGIKADNSVEVLQAGAYGVALISAVMASEDPEAVALAVVAKIKEFKLKKVL